MISLFIPILSSYSNLFHSRYLYHYKYFTTQPIPIFFQLHPFQYIPLLSLIPFYSTSQCTSLAVSIPLYSTTLPIPITPMLNPFQYIPLLNRFQYTPLLNLFQYCTVVSIPLFQYILIFQYIPLFLYIPLQYIPLF